MNKKLKLSPTINATLTLLRNRSRSMTFEIIADCTGLTVSWLTMFNRGRIRDPSISKIEALHGFLRKPGSSTDHI